MAIRPLKNIMESDMKEYQVKVTERHVDYVWIKANSREDAKSAAPGEACCEFECVCDCEVISEEPLDTPNT